MEFGMKNLALYLHVPFCLRKCRYCDFLSFSADASIKRDYVEALKREIEARGRWFREKGGYRLYSVFIGGGTPSILEGGQVGELLSSVWNAFGQKPMTNEVTLEANPGTITQEKIRCWKQAGVTRVSVGVQAAQNILLKRLGRVHTWEETLEGIQELRCAGFRSISADLMMGLPGQSLEDWTDTLAKILAMGVEHISCYSLILEEGTPFYREEAAGKLSLPSDEEERRMYHTAVRQLAAAGYRQYEISNFAKPGYACLHNLCYWDLTSYLGLGLGASSYLEGTRFQNTNDMQNYLKNSQYPRSIQENCTVVTQAREMEEYMFLGLRRTDGVEADSFRARFGAGVESVYGEALAALQRKGFLQFKEGRICLTELGRDFANQVFVEFLLDPETE
jgi:putative coproporphyrinogen dehydrogenase